MKDLDLNMLVHMVVNQKPTRLLRIEHCDHQQEFYECRDELTHAKRTLHKNDIMPAPQIPARFKRSAFDSVAHIIGHALRVFPAAFEVDTGDLALETLARKLREAREAKKLYGYTHPLVDDAAFAKHGADIVFSIIKGKLMVGAADSLKAPVESGSVLFKDTAQRVLVTIKDDADLERLCRLVSDRVFDPMPAFVVTKITPEKITDLERRYDCGFVKLEREEGYEIV